ncbi:MAG TPA: hypothetical protein VGO62_13365 [Myxococcota bacterium]
MLALSLVLFAVEPIIEPPLEPDASASTAPTAVSAPTVSAPPATSTPSVSAGKPPVNAPVKKKQTQKQKQQSVKRAAFHQHELEYMAPVGSGTPLALAFDGGHLDLDGNSDATFAFEPGQPVQSAWPRASTPWLVRDLDGSGAIESGRELFGSFTLLADGTRARDGFVALAALDSNNDGVIDARDAAFGSLSLWRDRNGNRVVDVGELEPLAHAGVTSLALHPSIHTRCDGAGNCERERAPFVYVDAHGAVQRGAVIDLHLRMRALVPAPQG